MKLALDHVVCAVPELARGLEAFADETGLRPVEGGPHPGLGTRNALVGFGPGGYLELIAPDPEQRGHEGLGRVLAELEGPALFAWAIRCDTLTTMASALAEAGVAATPALETRRRRPDGETLVWDLMGLPGRGGAWPFFIDWRDCPHPSETAPIVGPMQHFDVVLPTADLLALPFSGVEGARLATGPAQLSLAFESPRGTIEWRQDAPIGFFG